MKPIRIKKPGETKFERMGNAQKRKAAYWKMLKSKAKLPKYN